MQRKKQNLVQSFKSAFLGLKHAHTERNFFIQLFLGSIAIIASFILELEQMQKIIIIILSSLVLGMELFNSAMERMLDAIIQEHHPKVAEIKELMAGAVLVSSIGAFVIGLWIFLPILIQKLL